MRSSSAVEVGLAQRSVGAHLHEHRRRRADGAVLHRRVDRFARADRTAVLVCVDDDVVGLQQILRARASPSRRWRRTALRRSTAPTMTSTESPPSTGTVVSAGTTRPWSSRVSTATAADHQRHRGRGPGERLATAYGRHATRDAVRRRVASSNPGRGRASSPTTSSIHCSGISCLLTSQSSRRPRRQRLGGVRADAHRRRRPGPPSCRPRSAAPASSARARAGRRARVGTDRHLVGLGADVTSRSRRSSRCCRAHPVDEPVPGRDGEVTHRHLPTRRHASPPAKVPTYTSCTRSSAAARSVPHNMAA